ncbi:MAG: transglycosylase SLT domain-containing protein [Dysgonamonadaceae bacterium]|jgi:membrane-bound lytic murein transglycosylase D|nr:transglycosylase SLT domain-containing protein [Dysgonamonadaceae bacterium]
MNKTLIAMAAFGLTYSVCAQDAFTTDTLNMPETSGIDDGSSGIDDRAPGIIDSTSGIDDRTPGIDDSTPGIDDSTSGIIDSALYIPESLEANFDSLLQSWHVNYHTNRDNDCMEFERDLDPSDSIFAHRLKVLPKVMEMPYNEPVKRSILLYTEKRRKLIQYMLGLADYYFPSIEQILDENGLPLELKYLVIVESALNPTALSRVGASGLWQFMLPTGKIYGLEINSLVDERRDPIKSTHAACRYLKDMYALYGDWNLVIAAYNCGPGNVNKAIRRAKGQKDYWAIYNYLPKETRSYVPLFIGATYVMNYYREHNICPVSTTMPLSTDTIHVNRLLHLDQVAQVLKMDIEQLRALNPEFKKDIIPGNYKPYALRLPTPQIYAFIEIEADIYAYNVDRYFTDREYAGPDAAALSGKVSKITHRVSKGESMLTIANNYGVTASQIKKWNGLRSSKVYPGRKLTLYVAGGTYAAATADRTEPVVRKPAEKTALPRSPNGASYSKYKVKRGDTFYIIARKYPGIEARDLMRFNNIRNSTLKVGQIIKIPAG